MTSIDRRQDQRFDLMEHNERAEARVRILCAECVNESVLACNALSGDIATRCAARILVIIYEEPYSAKMASPEQATEHLVVALPPSPASMAA